jgi:hypothetical protein
MYRTLDTVTSTTVLRNPSILPAGTVARYARTATIPMTVIARVLGGQETFGRIFAAGGISAPGQL